MVDRLGESIVGDYEDVFRKIASAVEGIEFANCNNKLDIPW